MRFPSSTQLCHLALPEPLSLRPVEDPSPAHNLASFGSGMETPTNNVLGRSMVVQVCTGTAAGGRSPSASTQREIQQLSTCKMSTSVIEDQDEAGHKSINQYIIMKKIGK